MMHGRVMKFALVLSSILSMAGCSMGSSAPSGHTVKRLVAEASLADLVKMANLELRMDAPYGNEPPSSAYLRHKASVEDLQKDSGHYVHKIEASLHSKGCSKLSRNEYQCSLVETNPETHEKTSIVVDVSKAGQTWVLDGFKPAQ